MIRYYITMELSGYGQIIDPPVAYHLYKITAYCYSITESKTL